MFFPISSNEMLNFYFFWCIFLNLVDWIREMAIESLFTEAQFKRFSLILEWVNRVSGCDIAHAGDA